MNVRHCVSPYGVDTGQIVNKNVSLQAVVSAIEEKYKNHEKVKWCWGH